MEAGRELDALVAEKVLGEPRPAYIHSNALEQQLAGDPIRSPKGAWVLLCEYERGDVAEWRPIPFSANIAAAWSVVDEMRERGLYLGLDSDDHETAPFWASFSREGPDGDWQSVGNAAAPTAPLAICRAALAAVEGT